MRRRRITFLVWHAQEKVETAEKKKEEGNVLFKSGSYADALSLYVFFCPFFWPKP
jgi:hypothetical protein